jgi:hypothetical protein
MAGTVACPTQKNSKSQAPNPKQIPITEIQNSKPLLNASMTVLDIGELGF